MSIEKFVKDYKSRLINLINDIDTSVIEAIVSAIEITVQRKSKIYILGNGGSSATASHMVNDLGAGLRRRGILNLDVVSLADNTPVITAIANDIGYDNIFYMQMEGLLKPEDLVIAISCSGNSPNITKATQYAQKQGCKLIGITGFDGGLLKEMSDINFHVDVEKGQYGLVEDVHMILDHIIYSYYNAKANL
jgi:D-sedoheptulose 7-phosphate isomerase